MSISQRLSKLKGQLHDLIEEIDQIGQEMKMVEISKDIDKINSSQVAVKTVQINADQSQKKRGCELCMWWHPGSRSKQKQCEKFGPVPDEFAANPVGCTEFEDDIPF